MDSEEVKLHAAAIAAYLNAGVMPAKIAELMTNPNPLLRRFGQAMVFVSTGEYHDTLLALHHASCGILYALGGQDVLDKSLLEVTDSIREGVPLNTGTATLRQQVAAEAFNSVFAVLRAHLEQWRVPSKTMDELMASIGADGIPDGAPPYLLPVLENRILFSSLTNDQQFDVAMGMLEGLFVQAPEIAWYKVKLASHITDFAFTPRSAIGALWILQANRPSSPYDMIATIMVTLAEITLKQMKAEA